MAQQDTDQKRSSYARGDQRAFGLLYDRLSSPLYSLAVRMLGDSSEAQDALQEVFLQIWRRAAAYDAEQSTVFSWAVLMTRSRVIDRLRARERRLRVVVTSTDDDEAEIAPVPATSAESAADTIGRNEEHCGSGSTRICFRPSNAKRSNSHFLANSPITKLPLNSVNRLGQSKRVFGGAS